MVHGLADQLVANRCSCDVPPVAPGITYSRCSRRLKSLGPWTDAAHFTFANKPLLSRLSLTVKEDDCSVDGKSTCSSAPRRHVQSLLWSNLLAVIKAPEQPVVRAVIGSILIEENELLFQEADALEEILQGIESETQRHLSSHRLFDTPARLLLEQEIQSLLHSISHCSPEVQGAGNASQSVAAATPQAIQAGRKKASGTNSQREIGQAGNGRALTRENSGKSFNETSTFPKLVEPAATLEKLDLRPCNTAESLDPAISGRLVDSPTDKRVVSYIIGKSVLQERAKSGLSSDGWTSRTNSSRSVSSNPSSSHNELPESRASSGFSLASCNTGMVVDCLKPFLNCYDIDVVADKIRHALASERAVLLEDVAYLRDCLERSTELYSCVKNAPPSLGELRDCGKNLERRLKSEMQLNKVNKVLGSLDRKQALGVTQQEAEGLKPRTGRHRLPTLGILPKPDNPPMIGKDSNHSKTTSQGATVSSLISGEPRFKNGRRHSCGH